MTILSISRKKGLTHTAKIADGRPGSQLALGDTERQTIKVCVHLNTLLTHLLT